MANSREYLIHHTGTPAKKMKFELRNDNTKNGVVLRIPFPSSTNRKIIVSGKEIPPIKWDDVKRSHGDF